MSRLLDRLMRYGRYTGRRTLQNKALGD